MVPPLPGRTPHIQIAHSPKNPPKTPQTPLYSPSQTPTTASRILVATPSSGKCDTDGRAEPGLPTICTAMNAGCCCCEAPSAPLPPSSSATKASCKAVSGE
ncbi:hypothetical protein ACHAW6_000901 [Cyclotella cf. meneghiniana]